MGNLFGLFRALIALGGCVASLTVASAGTIAEARSAALGTTLDLDNVRVISTYDLVNSSLTRSIQVDDGTGAMTISGDNAHIAGLLDGKGTGDRISLRGKTQNQFGLFQMITPFTARGSELTGEVISPVSVSAADFADASATAEGLESRVVQLRQAKFVQKGQFAGLTDYSVVTAFGTVSVRVPSNFLDVVAQAIPAGEVNLTGIFYQFDQNAPYDSGYQIYLRSTTDIEAVPEPTTGLALLAGIAAWARRRRAA